MNFLHSIAKLLVAPLIAVLGFAGYGITPSQAPVKAPTTLGASNPSGGGTYRLQSSVGTADTSIPLSSFKEPISGTAYTMAYLNSAIEYGTLDPQQPTRSEFISFTGITQNADGTALLTGVTRGLSRSYPYTANSAVFAQSHSGQSIFILSDAPGLFNEYATKQNDQTISGQWTFTTPAIGPTPTSSTELANKAYVDGVALVSAPNADTSTKGVVQMSTGAQASAGTALGSTGASLVLGANLATSTCQVAGSSVLVASSTTGKLAPTCLDQTAPYTFTGTNTFTNTTTLSNTNFIATSTFTGTTILPYLATTTMAGESITAGSAVSAGYYQSDGGIKLDAKAGGGAVASSLSTSFTVGNNSNRILVVAIATNGATVSSISYGGQPMTLAASASQTSQYTYYLIAPATSSNTLVISLSGLVAYNYAVYSYYNAKQTAQPNAQGNSSSGVAAVSGSITPTAKGTLIFGWATWTSTGGAVSGATGFNQNTQFENVSNGSNYSAVYSGDMGVDVSTFATTLTATGSGTTINGGFINMLAIAPFTDPTFGYVVNSSAANSTSYSPITTSIYRANDFVGFALTSAMANTPITVAVSGLVQGLSSLVPLSNYYLGDTLGSISSSAGTNTRKAATAMSSTTAVITNIW